MTVVPDILCHQPTQKLHTYIPLLQAMVVRLCSRIGAPIGQLQMISVPVHLQPGITMAEVIQPHPSDGAGRVELHVGLLPGVGGGMLRRVREARRRVRA